MPRTDPLRRARVSLTTIQRIMQRRFPKRGKDGEAGAPAPVSPDPRPSLTGGAAARPDES